MRFRIQSFKPGKTEGLLGEKYAIIERKRKIISENETKPFGIRKDRELRQDHHSRKPRSGQHHVRISSIPLKTEKLRLKKSDTQKIQQMQQILAGFLKSKSYFRVFLRLDSLRVLSVFSI